MSRAQRQLYASGSGAALEPARLPSVVAELQRQLDEWREQLPASLAFCVDTVPAANESSGFLKQRYFACQGAIYRPYLA